ncbi:MAG: hypothetical protein WA274_02580, partial [Candidatus Acidiferrales bacterium]
PRAVLLETSPAVRQQSFFTLDIKTCVRCHAGPENTTTQNALRSASSIFRRCRTNYSIRNLAEVYPNIGREELNL